MTVLVVHVQITPKTTDEAGRILWPSLHVRVFVLASAITSEALGGAAPPLPHCTHRPARDAADIFA